MNNPFFLYYLLCNPEKNSTFVAKYAVSRLSQAKLYKKLL